MAKRLIRMISTDNNKQYKASCPWIVVDINSNNIDISDFFKNDGSINADAIFDMVEKDLLMRHKSELNFLNESKCL